MRLDVLVVLLVVLLLTIVGLLSLTADWHERIVSTRDRLEAIPTDDRRCCHV